MFVKLKVVAYLIVVCVVAIAVFSPIIVYSAVNHIDNKNIIVIDAGHGGMDGGVVGASGVKESDLNLAIAKRVDEALTDRGYNVIMTRKDGGALASTKKADMQKRKEIICNSNASLVVSIHINKFSDNRRCGAQVFYDDSKKWKIAGDIMQARLNEFINSKYARRNFEAIGGDYFITKCSDIPSIIVECGFISNAQEEERLRKEDYQLLLASIIADGVDNIIDDTK